MKTSIQSMIVVGLASLVIPSVALAQEEHRQLGPHEHGHGLFNMVFQGGKGVIELHIPGHDIIGFEHKPSTPAQGATLKKAIEQLKSGLTMFAPPEAAKCKLDSADVKTAKEEHHDDGDTKVEEGGGGHMEFRASYSFACDAPQKFDRIRFDFFKKYPAVEGLEVNIISDNGQSANNIKPANPVVVMPGN